MPETTVAKREPDQDAPALANFNTKIASAQTVPEIKELRDKATAMHKYLQSIGESHENQNLAAEAKIRCERKAGEMLAGMVLNKGTRLGGHETQPPGDEPRLSDLGVTKNQSSEWQIVAGLTTEIFDAYITKEKAEGNELTSRGVYLYAKKLLRGEPVEELMGFHDAKKKLLKFIELLLEQTEPDDRKKVGPVMVCWGNKIHEYGEIP